MLDLEKIALRDHIDRSYDLQSALSTKRIRLCSEGVVSKTSKPKVHVIEKIIEKHHHHEPVESQGIDEARLAEMMKKILLENQVLPQAAPVNLNDQILQAVNALQDKLSNMGGKDKSETDMPSIDPAKFAELQAKAIEKMSERIEVGVKKIGKKVILKNTNLSDLANELD